MGAAGESGDGKMETTVLEQQLKKCKNKNPKEPSLVYGTEKVGGKWYLCMKDTARETFRGKGATVHIPEQSVAYFEPTVHADGPAVLLGGRGDWLNLLKSRRVWTDDNTLEKPTGISGLVVTASGNYFFPSRSGARVAQRKAGPFS